MRASELAAELHAKAAGGGYVFRCPAHDDRSPSGRLREGRDGRTLIHCWAGCSPESIVQAIGLTIGDLFANDRPSSTRVADRRVKPLPPAEVKVQLVLDAQQIRAELETRGIFGELLTHELNDARRRVAARTGVRLEPLPQTPYEGGYGGRERDSLWPPIFEAAWERVCIAHLAAPVATLDELCSCRLRPPPLLFVLAEDLAAAMMSQEERRADPRPPRNAA